ncbi:hypothetical protein SprV_0602082100 [Sparganum proliferum]
MQTTLLLFSLVATFSLFHVSRGAKLCTWSQRIIPKNATGDITLEVPISYSYRTGYIGREPFWTYAGSRGWCSYNKGYFRCPYTAHDDYYATRLTLPNAEEISYVMLESEYPITLHKTEDESIPGFFVKEGTKLDICTDKKEVVVEWLFNGNESDLQHVSIYNNGKLVCSGLREAHELKDGRCKYTMSEGRLSIAYELIHNVLPRSSFYCYADKEKTIAQTYIIDWRGSPEIKPNPVTNVDKVEEITTTGAASLMVSRETTPSQVSTTNMVHDSGNSGAASLIDVAGVLLFNICVFLM